ncbi:MAG: endonuclease III [Bacilli bacterium]|nr:endonuclease III [Bacilli bacterium]
MSNEIVKYLDELFPDAKCELEYSKDYELLIAIMLSAQTKDERVNKVTRILNKKYPSLEKLANADLEDVKSIIKPLGNYNKKAFNVINIAKSLLNYDKIPNDRTFIESLPGVGHKTANVFLAMIYHEPCFAVDTHVTRVSKRLKISKEKDDVKIIEKKLMKYFKDYDIERLHHQLVLFGRYHCKAIKPNCDNCKLKNICKK